MAKVTDTREKVREVAKLIMEKGGQPTPTLVRKMLGDKGSHSTIVDELRKILAESIEDLPPTHGISAQKAVEQLGLEELAHSLRDAKEGTAHIQELLKNLSNLMSSAVSDVQGISDLKEICEKLGTALTLDKAMLEKELMGLIQRFDGMQHRMLMEIEAAREDARKWKANYIKTRDEGESWKISMTMRFNKQQEELAYLRGRLDERTNPNATLIYEAQTKR